MLIYLNLLPFTFNFSLKANNKLFFKSEISGETKQIPFKNRTLSWHKFSFWFWLMYLVSSSVASWVRLSQTERLKTYVGVIALLQSKMRQNFKQTPFLFWIEITIFSFHQSLKIFSPNNIISMRQSFDQSCPKCSLH